MNAILSPKPDTDDAASQASLLPADGAAQSAAQSTGTPANDANAAAGAATGASDSSGASGSSGAADPKTLSPEEIIAKIDEETQANIRKLVEDANRRKALALKKAIPLPQRKTTAFDFLEAERDRMRTALDQPLLSDADVDAHIKSALDTWHAQRAAAN